MGSLFEIIRAFEEREFSSEDGDTFQIELQPACAREDYPWIRGKLPADPEIEALLERTSGFDLGPLEVRFDESLSGQFIPGLSAESISVLEDGFGNSWNVDIDPKSGKWKAVYFVCHDPPVVVVQSASLAEFLKDVFRNFGPSEGQVTLDHIRDTAAMKVWNTGGVEVAATSLAGSLDPTLRRAAQAAGPNGVVADLRACRPGDGFRWPPGDRDGDVIRIGEEPVFALPSNAQKVPTKRRFWFW